MPALDRTPLRKLAESLASQPFLVAILIAVVVGFCVWSMIPMGLMSKLFIQSTETATISITNPPTMLSDPTVTPTEFTPIATVSPAGISPTPGASPTFTRTPTATPTRTQTPSPTATHTLTPIPTSEDELTIQKWHEKNVTCDAVWRDYFVEIDGVEIPGSSATLEFAFSQFGREIIVIPVSPTDGYDGYYEFDPPVRINKGDQAQVNISSGGRLLWSGELYYPVSCDSENP